MIRLADVSTSRMIDSFERDISGVYVSVDVSKALNKYYVRDYQQLELLVNSGDEYFNNEIFKSWLKLIKENVDYANGLGIEPTIFACNNYQEINIDKKFLKPTDKKTFCRHLVINNPILGPSDKFSRINSLSIYEMKFLLEKVVAYDKKVVGNNALLDSYPPLTVEDAIRIRNAINFYEQQVACQFFETTKKGGNLFSINKEEKQSIINSEIKDIIEYIVDNASRCIWGELTPNQKKQLAVAIKNNRSIESNRIIQRLTNLICNYTTLSEIKNGVKQKILDRFIVR